MRQDRMRRSANVQDRRGVRQPMAIGGLGGGGLIVLVIIVVLMGGNPLALLGGGGGGGGGPIAVPGSGAGPAGNAPRSPQDEAAGDLVARVLGDTEDVWNDLFQQMGRDYQEPTLVLFTGAVESACGQASAAVGPFYCPADRTIYIDLAFFDDLARRHNAPGDFAQAYVIAHEVGHHVQNLLGQMRHEERASGNQREANAISVRVELQADFYAGVWAHHAQATRGVLERGDIEEGLAAASAVGDDRLQREAQGRVVPDSFTHGSSDQRTRAFMAGYEAGDPSRADQLP